MKERKEYNDIVGFEDKLIQNTSLIVAICTFIITIFYVKMIGLNSKLTYTYCSAIVVYSILYILASVYNKYIFVRCSISLVSLVYLNLTWYFNYFSKGPIIIIFLVYFCFLILIGNKRRIIIFGTITFINLIVLFLVEFNFHEILPSYLNEKTRIVNVYVVSFIAFIIVFILLYQTKINYIKQYLKAKKADELKSSFLANMSHEIRTPLNAIVGFSSLLTNKNYDSEKKEKYRSYINSNSEYLLHLVNDILDISRIESNQLDLVIEEFKVDDLFEQLQEEYTAMLQKIKKTDISLDYNLHDEHLILKTDKFRFEQIVRNFLSNAIKFTEKGHITLRSYQKDKKYIFYVEDTGNGIPKDDLNQIFSRFTKLNNNIDTIHRGVGLGLFLSKQLSELLGGRIWAESEEGEGSKFYLELPVLFK